MTNDIHVRKIRFDFEPSAPLEFSDCSSEFGMQATMLGISLTMPYLEPYLIRTMKAAIPEIRDAALAEDTKNFSRQEGHHYRNHAKFNLQVHEFFGSEVSKEVAVIEKALEADYQRFTRSKSLRFNLAYAEGFEAMTCALAVTSAEHEVFRQTEMLPGGELWAWHMAEEIEHRTVAFNVYDHIVGSYPYRVAVGAWAQWHYLRYVMRFAKSFAKSLGRKIGAPKPEIQRTYRQLYLRTWSPRYDPAKMEVPPVIHELLGHYDAAAAAAEQA